MANAIKIGINGAAGRMGRRIVALAHADESLVVGAALEAADSALQGRDAGEVAGIGPIGVRITAELVDRVDVLIDFSTPAGLLAAAELCARRQIPLVAATTGLSEADRNRVLSAAHNTPLLLAPNMSLAVNLCMKLVRQAARTLKAYSPGVDVEIIERHHRLKVDAPSGTALALGKIVAGEMGQTSHVHGREGHPGKRPQTEIGYHALRVGDNVGEHTVVFGLIGETLEIHVRNQSRDSYALGALAAAKFLVKSGPGLYSMDDVFGLA